jgi:hypothetical protein
MALVEVHRLSTSPKMTKSQKVVAGFGWAYLSYTCLSEEASWTRRRVIQLVALLEAQGVLEVRRGHGRGHVNFYRILREEDG